LIDSCEQQLHLNYHPCLFTRLTPTPTLILKIQLSSFILNFINNNLQIYLTILLLSKFHAEKYFAMGPVSRSKKSTTVLDDSSPSTQMASDPNQATSNQPTAVISEPATQDRFETLLHSIKANQINIDQNQATIQALVSKLDITSSVLETTSKRLIDLSDQVQVMNTIVTETLPQEIQSSIESVRENLRIDFSTAITDFSSKVYQDLTTYHSDSVNCFKSHATNIAKLATNVSDLSRTLCTIQDTSLSRLDVERLVVAKWQDELDPHIQSHYDLQKEVHHQFSTLDSKIKTTVEAHLDTYQHTMTSSTTTHGSTARSRQSVPTIGFHQSDSKDFCVSKLQKEIKDIKLLGDTLKELEIFWDAVLCAFTNLCHLQIYPYYRDLQPTFDFQAHLVGDENTTQLSSADYNQAKRNYRTFGDALRIFLRAGSTISETTCPQAYLCLLSLCDTQDGFSIFKELIFTLSPQLSGDYRDFRQDIIKISIHPGEHLSKLYQRIIELSTEIKLAHIKNGSMAELALHFLTLL
jgi:hypothetical protein